MLRATKRGKFVCLFFRRGLQRTRMSSSSHWNIGNFLPQVFLALLSSLIFALDLKPSCSSVSTVSLFRTLQVLASLPQTFLLQSATPFLPLPAWSAHANQLSCRSEQCVYSKLSICLHSALDTCSCVCGWQDYGSWRRP